MRRTTLAAAASLSAAAIVGTVLWFSAVGMSGSPCRAPSVASVEALFASCTGPIPAAQDGPWPGGPPAPLRSPDPNAPAVAGSGTDVEATGATNRRRDPADR